MIEPTYSQLKSYLEMKNNQKEKTITYSLTYEL
jgi:hypothetical protein